MSSTLDIGHYYIDTYCHDKLVLIPSRNRSRKERCRLGVDPVTIMCWWCVSDGDEEKNFVGLKCCCDSRECDGDDDLKLGAILLNGERCFGDSRDVAITQLFFKCNFKIRNSREKSISFFVIRDFFQIISLCFSHQNCQVFICCDDNELRKRILFSKRNCFVL